MSFSNATETALWQLVFQNANWAGVGDATGLRNSTAAGNFHVALHTADPGEAGDQTATECNYTGYGRIAVARAAAGWAIATNTVSNNGVITFNQCTNGTNTVSHFSVGHNTSGASPIIVSGALTSNLAVSAGITPSFAANQLTAVLD
jgi:hypothetical protein